MPIATLDNAFNITGALTAGSSTVTAVSDLTTIYTQTNTVTPVQTGTTGLVAGQSISGPGIAAGTYIAAVNSSTSLTLSQPATASLTANLMATPWVNVSSAVLSNSYLTNINHAISLTGSWGAATSTVVSNVSSTLGLAIGGACRRLRYSAGNDDRGITSTITLSGAASAGTGPPYTVAPITLPITATTTAGTNASNLLAAGDHAAVGGGRSKHLGNRHSGRNDNYLRSTGSIDEPLRQPDAVGQSDGCANGYCAQCDPEQPDGDRCNPCREPDDH